MSETRKKPLLPVISAFSLIGAVISIWQTRLFFATRSGMGEFHSFCNIGDKFDCTAIEMSKYSELFSGFPLSGFAIAGYLTILILSIYGLSEMSKRNLRSILLIFTGVSALFSLFYLFIMLFVIGKLCLLCLILDAINFTLFLLTLGLPKNSDYDTLTPGLSVLQTVGAGAISIAVALLISKAVDPQSEMKREDMNDIVESVMNSPVTPITPPADAPVVGNPNAPITVVKFSDYQCPACRMGAKAIHPLFKRYPKDVKFVFVNFPLATECNPDPELKRTMHEFACEAAAVAVCATQQGKFIETYETLFEYQNDFKMGEIADLLASHVPGIDLPKLKDCTHLPSTAEKIKRDAQLGMQAHIVSTPTFFLNGRKIEGGLPTNLWMQILDKMVAAGH